MLEEFKKYVNTFYTGNEEIDKGFKLKYAHSLRVKDIMEEMAINFDFDDKKMELASVIGLLHDYGRFYQWKNYQTFNDLDSIDHADYGVLKLFEEGEIINFYSNTKNYNLISDAIKYHNKYDCPDEIFCKMIRDADKIDILNIFGTDIVIDEEGEISKKIHDDFYLEKLIDNNDQKSKADSVIKTLGFIYDLNYSFSFKYLNQHKIIDKVYNSIKDKDKFKPYFEKTKTYIKQKIKEDK